MVTNRGDQIVTKTFRTKSEHRHDFREERSRAPRIIGIARIRAPHMRTKWATNTFWIAVIGELILPDFIGLRSDASDGLPLNRH